MPTKYLWISSKPFKLTVFQVQDFMVHPSAFPAVNTMNILHITEFLNHVVNRVKTGSAYSTIINQIASSFRVFPCSCDIGGTVK
ncbi:hypothetical protein D3Z45_02200 [Lachnospiraceae bacterium]|nr:hypothetical protein [Lachnospiraceae bacterium]